MDKLFSKFQRDVMNQISGGMHRLADKLGIDVSEVESAFDIQAKTPVTRKKVTKEKEPADSPNESENFTKCQHMFTSRCNDPDKRNTLCGVKTIDGAKFCSSHNKNKTGKSKGRKTKTDDPESVATNIFKQSASFVLSKNPAHKQFGKDFYLYKLTDDDGDEHVFVAIRNDDDENVVVAVLDENGTPTPLKSFEKASCTDADWKFDESFFDKNIKPKLGKVKVLVEKPEPDGESEDDADEDGDKNVDKTEKDTVESEPQDSQEKPTVESDGESDAEKSDEKDEVSKPAETTVKPKAPSQKSDEEPPKETVKDIPKPVSKPAVESTKIDSIAKQLKSVPKPSDSAKTDSVKPPRPVSKTVNDSAKTVPKPSPKSVTKPTEDENEVEESSKPPIPKPVVTKKPQPVKPTSVKPPSPKSSQQKPPPSKPILPKQAEEDGDDDESDD